MRIGGRNRVALGKENGLDIRRKDGVRMLLGQVGMGGIGEGIAYGVADIFATWTAALGLALGSLALATSFLDRQAGELSVYAALGAMGCAVAYCVWWGGLGVVPTGWPAISMTTGGAASGTWAIWRYARRLRGGGR